MFALSAPSGSAPLQLERYVAGPYVAAKCRGSAQAPTAAALASTFLLLTGHAATESALRSAPDSTPQCFGVANARITGHGVDLYRRAADLGRAPDAAGLVGRLLPLLFGGSDDAWVPLD